jgi:hypothetical protein
MNLYAVNPGVDTGSVAVIEALAGSGTPVETRQSVEAVVTELSQLPGVTSAAGAMKIPLTGRGNSMGLLIPHRPDIKDVTTYFRVGTVDYSPRWARGSRGAGTTRPPTRCRAPKSP